MTSPTTYGTLFTHLKKRIRKKASAERFHLVREFSGHHGVDADGLIAILEAFGGTRRKVRGRRERPCGSGRLGKKSFPHSRCSYMRCGVREDGKGHYLI